ncbi:putative gamma-cysteine synthetase regulatory subunit [Delphinella strobiligena]|nr:putative gamma-cysteine synthetase regulatory subunit [Delphinella strobiligena]
MPQGFLGHDKSNAELKSSLRFSFEDAREHAALKPSQGSTADLPYATWTSNSKDSKTLYVPKLDFTESALTEEREQYDITVKIFFLPAEDMSAREDHLREAVDLVLKELHMPNIDLLILQFPEVYFDEETEACPDKIKSRGPRQAEPEPVESQVKTWGLAEKLKEEGLVLRLGVSEFGAERLAPFLEKVKIQPAVDQISLRDCCSVPKPLTALAKEKKIELLVHNDIVNILSRGTLRELLDEGGADILGQPISNLQAGHKRKRNEGSDLAERKEGEIEPQWVVKYTAVVRNRGVVENKGYFACAKYLE